MAFRGTPSAWLKRRRGQLRMAGPSLVLEHPTFYSEMPRFPAHLNERSGSFMTWFNRWFQF